MSGRRKPGRPRGTKPKTSSVSYSQPSLHDMQQSPVARDVLHDEEADITSPLQGISSSIESALSRISVELQRIERDFEKALAFTNSRLNALEKKEAKFQSSITALEERIEHLEKSNTHFEDAINKQERFSRRNNIRIVGVPHSTDENLLEISKKILQKIGVEDTKIERAHRDGKLRTDRPQHILVRLSYFQDKIFTLKNQRAKLHDVNYFVTDDLTLLDLEEKRKWSKQVSDLYSKGTRLFFSGGKWRSQGGRPFHFREHTTPVP